MNLTQLYLDTFIPEYPKIINGNFASVSRYVDVFYDGSLGILTKPLNTTGRVKGARGEFVTVVVDNLIVKNQFTNLFDNNTTADYNFYKLYIDPAVQPRDPCTASDFWPAEYAGNKYIDVNKPYYKIQNIGEYYVLNNNNLSQVVGIFLDPSLVSPTNQFKVILNPITGANFTADSSAAGDPSMGTGFYVEFVAVAYDPSFGTTWAQYKHGLPVVGTGSGGGGGIGGSGTAPHIPIFNSGTTIADSVLTMTGSTLNTFAQTVDGIITLTNKQIKGVATPTNLSDAVNLDYTSQFTTNVSVNNALGQFIRSASTGPTLVWNAGTLDVSINVAGISFADMQTYVDPSLARRDSSITNLYVIKANNASLGLYATNASIGLAGFAKNASLGLYATNASVNLALGAYATNASIGLAGFATNASIGLAGFAKQIYVDGSLTTRDSSITWLFTNSLTTSALLPYATNASIGVAGFLNNIDISSFATNASVGLAIAPFATNASVNTTLAQFIRSTSTGVTLYWNAGVLDVSAVPSTGPSFAYIDGSLLTRDLSINWLYQWKLEKADADSWYVQLSNLPTILGPFATNTSVNNAFYNYYTSTQVDNLLLGYITQAYVDGSLYLQQLQINSLDNRVTILENSTGHVDFVYLDGSLATRDSSIIALFNNLSTTDTSLAALTFNWGITDASLYALTIAALDFATNTSINAAGFAKNVSLNYLYNWQLSQDASIGLIIGTNATQTGQINALQTRSSAIETSVAYLNLHSVKDSSLSDDFAWVGGVLEVSIAAVTDAATNASMYYELSLRDIELYDLSTFKADLLYIDTTLGNYIPSASTGIGLFWDASGFLDVSIASSISQAYVDGSLAQYIKSSSTGFGLYWNGPVLDVSVEGKNYDASIASIEASIVRIDNSLNDVIDVSIILGDYATNSSVGLALSNYIKSASTGSTLKWNAGLLDVSISTALSLSALSDVSVGSIADKSLIQYDSSSGKWVNTSPLDASAYFQRKLTQGTIPGTVSTGTAGDWSYDASYLYICTSTNLWGRVALSAF